jgi:nicotinate-nucleotide--dimethylbenzimidazole phosphoribosyltransferase
MMPVEAPTRLPGPPAALGRLGDALGWLARAQGAWPPRPPAAQLAVHLREGTGVAGGIEEADRLADAGVDLLVVDGPTATTAALVVLCALLGVEPVVAVGTAASPDWSERVVAVRDALPAARAAVGDPERLLADPLVGHLAGLLAQSAVRRTPVVLGSSPVVAAAALAAERLAPGARSWWLAAAVSNEPVVRRARADLDLEPLLDLGLDVPGTTGFAADLLVRGISLTDGSHTSTGDGITVV